MAKPSHRNPCTMGHEIYNFDRGLTVLSIQFFSYLDRSGEEKFSKVVKFQQF